MADEFDFSGRKFRISLQRQMQIEFLSQTNWNYMVDAACCPHALVLYSWQI